MIRTTRQESHSNKRIKYSEEDCDYFVTYYEGKNYLIPVNQCSNSKTLRILKPKNGQTKDINFLKDFEDEEVLKKYKHYKASMKLRVRIPSAAP